MTQTMIASKDNMAEMPMLLDDNDLNLHYIIFSHKLNNHIHKFQKP